jgi:hypothetical protein
VQDAAAEGGAEGWGANGAAADEGDDVGHGAKLVGGDGDRAAGEVSIQHLTSVGVQDGGADVGDRAGVEKLARRSAGRTSISADCPGSQAPTLTSARSRWSNCCTVSWTNGSARSRVAVSTLSTTIGT